MVAISLISIQCDPSEPKTLSLWFILIALNQHCWTNEFKGLIKMDNPLFLGLLDLGGLFNAEVN